MNAERWSDSPSRDRTLACERPPGFASAGHEDAERFRTADISPHNDYIIAAASNADGFYAEAEALDANHSGDSDSSITNNVDENTPPETPGGDVSPSKTALTGIRNLSLDKQFPPHFTSPRRKHRHRPFPDKSTCAKRSGDGDLAARPAKQSPISSHAVRMPSSKTLSAAGTRKGKGGPLPVSKTVRQESNTGCDYGGMPQRTSPYQVVHRDSGYLTGPPTRENTVSQATSLKDPWSKTATAASDDLAWVTGIGSPDPGDGTGIIRQPQASPLPTPQLAAEIKGIYAGLVMVEAKCINIDAHQSKNLTQPLGPDQWQALIAIHRTLLYEHHDFLMATQHPSANEVLRSLALKYAMPARMWRHGIHSFLEVLRHRRPESQDYMLSFIYLSYQMIGLMYETVPAFTDTWIECLGDLARYRMAIESDVDIHGLWSGVATRWYSTGSARQPSIGRLYHHLGILERPGLRKLFLYAKSLTCVSVFPNAKDSLTTFCRPIAEDSRILQKIPSLDEAAILEYLANSYAGCQERKLDRLWSQALASFERMTTSDVRYGGVYLIITNVASLLEFGSLTNELGKRLWAAVQEPNDSATPSSGLNQDKVVHITETQPESTRASSLAYDFCYTTFQSILNRQSPKELRAVLPSVHTFMAYLRGVITLIPREINTSGTLLFRVDWGLLASFMNRIMELEPYMEGRTIGLAKQGAFPWISSMSRPLPEDFCLQGLVWAHKYYPPGWFDQMVADEDRMVEDDNIHKHRVTRVQWLAVWLAQNTEHMRFDANTRRFSVTTSPGRSPRSSCVEQADEATEDSYSTDRSPGSRSSVGPSEFSGSDDFVHVIGES